MHSRLHALALDYEPQLRETIFPAFATYVAEAKRLDLPSLSTSRLIECWQDREKEVLDIFGAKALMPSLLSEMAIAELRAFLAESFWDEDPDLLAYLISSGGPPDRTVTRDAELYEVGKGSRSLKAWLGAHGHRAADELELAAPRWREQSEDGAVREMAAHLASGDSPLERHDRNADAVNRRIAPLRQRLSGRPARNSTAASILSDGT